MKSKQKKKITIGIDFGSTYSGFAYSFNDINDIKFTSLNEENSYCKFKTEILINKDTKEVKKWGDDAYNTFLHMNEIEKNKYLYFKGLKLNLDPNVNNSIIYPVNCQNYSYELKNIISIFLKEIKNKAIEVINGLSGNKKIKNNEINWSVTAPAIWNEFGKQFMKECAEIAGMDNVKIVLEPEAASLTMLNDHGIDDSLKKPGKVFMLIDAGGYTVDFTVNEVCKDNSTGEIIFKQLSPPSGGPWGSSFINKDIEDIIKEIFGEKYTNCFMSNDKDAVDYLMDTIKDIENEKKDFDLPFENKIVRIRADYDDKVKNEIQLKNGGIVKYKKGRLIFSGELFYSIIKKRIEPIIKHISELLKEVNTKIDQIVLAGGFSCNKILTNEITNKFQNESRKVSKLTTPGASVMKGSVIYNIKPTIINERKSPYTYGSNACIKYNSKEHLGRPVVYNDNNEPYVEIFNIYIKKDENVKNGQVVKHTYSLFYYGQNKATFSLYSTNKREPKYCDENGVKKIGDVNLEIIEDVYKPKNERELELSIEFGSCLFVTARNLNTREMIKTTFNYFLNE